MPQDPKPTLAELIATARVVSLPLRNKFRGVLEREALLFEGPNGWAEWSPFVEYDDAEASVWLRAAIEFAYGELPALKRESIEINATLGAVAVDRVADSLKRFGQFGTVKIKVAEPGQTVDDDVARVLEVARLWPDARIRLDANGALNVAGAVSLVERLRLAGIELEYFEQPVASLTEMIEAKAALNSLGVRVAADELVRKAEDPLEVARAEAADVLVLKVAPLGGVVRATEIAREAGLPVVVSSALETSIGISMGLHLAAALDSAEFAAGLGTVAMFAGDVSASPLIAEGGRLPVRRVTPDAAKLDIFAAEDHRQDWWLERLERCLLLI